MPGGSLWNALRVFALAGALFAVAITGMLWWGSARPLPSDADLRKGFQVHRAEFDSLAAMALADTLLVGAGIWPGASIYVRDTPLHDRRLTEDEVMRSGRSAYRRLLKRAGIPSVSRTRKRRELYFVVRSAYARLPARSRVPVVSSSGQPQRTATSVSGRYRKGFVYAEEPVQPLVSSLDSLESYGFVVLAPRWFMFLYPVD
jgi:hypothetical protein